MEIYARKNSIYMEIYTRYSCFEEIIGHPQGGRGQLSNLSNKGLDNLRERFIL